MLTQNYIHKHETCYSPSYLIPQEISGYML